MTVREAFALAGYPVPEGATLVWASFDWIATANNPWKTYCFLEDEWVPETDICMGFRDIDLSNLPAKNAWSALPTCVRKAIPLTSPTSGEKE